ncbi:MAG TPA: hypothetical protein VKV24_09445 [Casimicrobiaceae bacterium]|nr:hypothetical protein [Casimicrobiaceae bacterium]
MLATDTAFSGTIRKRARCTAGRVSPASRAMVATSCATTADESFPSWNIVRRSAAVSFASRNAPPSRSNARSNASAIDSTAMTLFFDEQLVALSKVFDLAIFAAASATSAVSSTITATLPTPTPIAGVPLS